MNSGRFSADPAITAREHVVMVKKTQVRSMMASDHLDCGAEVSNALVA